MKNYIESSNQNIIRLLDGEQDYFDNFVKKNSIHWFSEDRKNAILNLSKAYVGYIVTPKRKITLHPKYKEINFEHIFRMYLYVYGYKSTDSAAVLDVSKAQDEIDVAKLFFDSLQKDIQLGILQTYQRNSIDSRELQGRINYSKTWMNYLKGKRKFVSTNVSKMSLNNNFNRLIATALKQLMHVKKYSTKASSFFMYFNDVDTNIVNGSDLLESMTFNSNTSRYKKTLIYAAMIIDQLDYDDIGDSIGTESFIINSDKLFEDFVVKILKNVPQEREFITWKSAKKYADILSKGIIQDTKYYLPDILFKYIEEDDNHDFLPSSYAVLDVKNKAYGTFKNADLYQILTYAKLLHSQKALLLYPAFSRKTPESLVLNPEIFNPSLVIGCYINIADSSGDEFLKSINFFVDVVERVLMDIDIKSDSN